MDDTFMDVHGHLVCSLNDLHELISLGVDKDR